MAAMWKETLKIWAFGWLKIPMIAYLRPTVQRLDDEQAVIRFKLNRRSRNHLGSMYFGALSVGADLAGGILAMQQIEKSGKPVSLVFGSFKADFHKRPMADVDFVCKDGAAIRDLVQKAIETGERVSMPVTIIATTPSLSGDEAMATMVLELSLKLKDKSRT
jgi:acyl-coenzyme A thioesterase PaaI-like protein